MALHSKYTPCQRKLARVVAVLVNKRNEVRDASKDHPQLEPQFRKKYDDLGVKITFLNYLIENKYAVEWKNGY